MADNSFKFNSSICSLLLEIQDEELQLVDVVIQILVLLFNRAADYMNIRDERDALLP